MTGAVGTTEASRSAAPRRFSPVFAGRDVVPFLYAGRDLACALAESVFHDLAADTAEPQEILRADLLTLRVGTIATTTDHVVLGSGPVWNSRRSPQRLSFLLFVQAPAVRLVARTGVATSTSPLRPCRSGTVRGSPQC